jgi:hypothetical protein
MRFVSCIILSLIITASTGCGSNPDQDSQFESVANRKSPISISTIKHEGTYIKVVYGQPYKNGRTIFGDWEPYGEVWRTGANEATEITFTRPVLMSENVIEAGTYSLFTIPEETKWTIILNSELGQWGAFEYDQRRDYVRFEIPVIMLETPVEAFTIAFDEVQNSLTTMSLSWDDVRVEIPIRFYGE